MECVFVLYPGCTHVAYIPEGQPGGSDMEETVRDLRRRLAEAHAEISSKFMVELLPVKEMEFTIRRLCLYNCVRNCYMLNG